MCLIFDDEGKFTQAEFEACLGRVQAAMDRQVEQQILANFCEREPADLGDAWENHVREVYGD